MSVENIEKGSHIDILVDVEPKCNENINIVHSDSEENTSSLDLTVLHYVSVVKSSDIMTQNTDSVEIGSDQSGNIPHLDKMPANNGLTMSTVLNSNTIEPVALIETKETIEVNSDNVNSDKENIPINNNCLESGKENTGSVLIENVKQSDLNDLTSETHSVQENSDFEDVLSNFTKESLLENQYTKDFTMSSISLNENNNLDKEHIAVCKSPFSRSEENVSTYNHNVEHDKSLHSSTKELNTDTILTEFTNQKAKVSAVQKIPTETNQPKVDARQSRLNKELLTQDLGSIVKNVHGIFSSVSKTAYSISQKASTQFKYPVAKVNISSKTIPNGRIMDDIFEDELAADKLKEQEYKMGAQDVENVTSTSEDTSSSATEIENEDTESDIKSDVAKLHVESLEKMLGEKRKEMAALRERVRQQADEMQEKDQIFKDLEGKMDLMRKRVEQAEREKDAAVMRYAGGECAAIEARRAADAARRAERAARAEAELLAAKLRSAHAEKQRICQLYDDKCHELLSSERELSKTREDHKELEGRLKWTQSKLRLEIEASKECAERADKLSQQVSELVAGREAAALSATDSLRAKHLESELEECRASLILSRHEKEDLERRLGAASQQLEVTRRELEQATGSLAEHTAKVAELSESNMRLGEEAASLAALRAQASLADTLASQLQRQSERAEQAEEELSRSRARAETCARREAAALEHAARLTAAHVADSAARERAQAQALALGADNTSLRERVSALEAEAARLEAALAAEAERRHKENRVLARKVAELTEEVEEGSKKLEWEKGENAVLKKKHGSAIKELNRELQRALKRCEQLESKIPQSENDTSTRTGSVSSLSSGESAPAAASEERLQNGHTNDAVPDIQMRSPDQQALIERIVSLQRAAARRAERCDFLEEHARQLTAELRRKARLLRHLMAGLPTAALADSDRHKKEIARLGGGAMAAVWGGDAGGMSLELSLEMNRRLQTVLEDTLHKNITLKENMDTLGEEISRLKTQHNPTTNK